MRPNETELGEELYECFDCGVRTSDADRRPCGDCGGDLRHLDRARDL